MKKVILLFISTLFVFQCFSQIEGNVVDSAGKALAGAEIIAIDSVTLVTDSVNCDSSGFYAFKKLKPGIYTLTTKAVNYQVAVNKNVLVETGFKEKKSADISSAVWLEIVLIPLKTQK